MVLGRCTRFMQYLRVNAVRLIKHPIDEGISSIAVLLKSSIRRPSIIHGFSGKFLNLEHVERSRALWNLKPQVVLGRHTSFLQSLRVSRSQRPLGFPRFSGKSSKFEHPKRSRRWSELKLQMVQGRRTRFLQSLRVNELRVVKPSIDEGISFIAVPHKSR